MTPRRFEAWLQNAIERVADDEDEDGSLDIETIEDFVQAGLLTSNRGVVVALEDGSEFQITIVQSQRGRRNDEEVDE